MWRLRRCLRSASIAVIVAVGAVALGACESDSTNSGSTSTAPASLSVDSALAAQLPARIRESGQLLIATDVPYEPIIASQGGKYVGFDADVATALGQLLGVTPVFRTTAFSTIIAGVQDGTYDTGLRGIFDTLARERRVDLVSYFSAGTQWAQPTGKHVDPNNACGLRVAVSAGTVQATVEIPAKSQACTTVGEKAITAVPFDSIDAAVAGLEAGKADAISADSPAIAFAVHKSHDTLALAGDIFDTEPYALPVAKNSPLGPTLRDAVQRLIDSGEMRRIARKWGLEDGLIKQSTINTAIS